MQAFSIGGFVAILCLTLATPWTVARQAPLSMGFSRQEYRSGLPFPPPGDLPHPGIKLAFPALAGRLSTSEPPGKHMLLRQGLNMTIYTQNFNLTKNKMLSVGQISLKPRNKHILKAKNATESQ